MKLLITQQPWWICENPAQLFPFSHPLPDGVPIFTPWHPQSQEVIAEHISARLWIEDLRILTKYVHTYVRMWWVRFRNVARSVITYNNMHRPYVRHTVWHIQICLTQIHVNVIDRGRWHSLAMEMEVDDDSAAGPSQLGYYNQLLLQQMYHVPHAHHLHPHIIN